MRGILESVADSELPDAWVGAGVLRDLVWDTRFGAGFDPSNVKDVDVAFFDAADLSVERETSAEHRLRARAPDIAWDVKNQARVHQWYEQRFGVPVDPLTSTLDGVGTWPETASAIAVRVSHRGELEIAAPFGLDDLLDGIWRRNPRRVTLREYRARVERKQPTQRWRGITVVN
jgi:uncharacterized protein